MSECKRTKQFNHLSGQSIIEVIVSVAILIIIASTAVIAVLGSFSSTRLAEEETQAAFFASEGIEAVQSIRNNGWDDPFLATDCSAGCGLSKSGDVWSFSGTSDDPDGSAKFTRIITVESVQRDDNWDIVEPGGTDDPDTKKVISAITWDFTPTRSNTVEMASYLTNWQEGRNSPLVSPSPSPPTCSDYCLGLVSYSGGTCRQNAIQCSHNGETHEFGGDTYCIGGASADTCCCAP